MERAPELFLQLMAALADKPGEIHELHLKSPDGEEMASFMIWIDRAFRIHVV